MAKITIGDIGKILNLGGAVTDILSAQAEKKSTDISQADVDKIAPQVTKQVEAAAKDQVKAVLAEAQSKIDYQMNQEILPKSWSMNAAVVAVLSSGLTIYGALSDGLQMDKDQIILLGAGGTLISALTWLIGRLRGKPIGE